MVADRMVLPGCADSKLFAYATFREVRKATAPSLVSVMAIFQPCRAVLSSRTFALWMDAPGRMDGLSFGGKDEIVVGDTPKGQSESLAGCQQGKDGNKKNEAFHHRTSVAQRWQRSFCDLTVSCQNSPLRTWSHRPMPQPVRPRHLPHQRLADAKRRTNHERGRANQRPMAGSRPCRFRNPNGGPNGPRNGAGSPKRAGCIADILTAEGLTEFQVHPDDQRTKLVAITPTGLSVLAAIYQRNGEWSQRIQTRLAPEAFREVWNRWNVSHEYSRRRSHDGSLHLRSGRV